MHAEYKDEGGRTFETVILAEFTYHDRGARECRQKVVILDWASNPIIVDRDAVLVQKN